VIPEIASRRQLEYINIVTAQALKTAGMSFGDIDAVAVTREPGLMGSLLVGISFANSLSYALGKPLIKVNHIQAHIYANYLLDLKDASRSDALWEDLKLPAIGLVVSGGHSSLFHIKDFMNYRLIGQTRDDAPGEAYDKVARILGLGYPGGPVIDRLARAVSDNKIVFPSAAMEGSHDFSFSGLKTAVLYYIQKHQKSDGFSVDQVAGAFQDSVVRILVEKSIKACRARKVKTLLIGGGVAANSALREALKARGEKEGIRVNFPGMPLCMDNAAMIAGLGYHLMAKPVFARV
jgi:N6-L-threonylcarbamoyladenine synthase